MQKLIYINKSVPNKQYSLSVEQTKHSQSGQLALRKIETSLFWGDSANRY